MIVDNDNKNEIILGTNDGSIYCYNLIKKENILNVNVTNDIPNSPTLSIKYIYMKMYI